MIVQAYRETYKFPINITRCSNNYGPYQFPEKLIPLIIKNILEGKDLPVYGDGKNVRDWVYVEDHCKAIDLILEKGKIGEIYNIGGSTEKQNIEIVKIIIDIIKDLINKNQEYLSVLKTDLSNINYGLVKYVKDRKGHDKRYAVDSTKIKDELGWSPETEFENGITETIKWYLDNQDWIKNVVFGSYQEYYDKMYGKR
jgi:dTDP-glucose 4,6-dehydratase